MLPFSDVNISIFDATEMTSFLTNTTRNENQTEDTVLEDPNNAVGRISAGVAILLITIGVLGNFQIIVLIARSRRLHRSYNVLIASLAFTDLLFNSTTMPLYADAYLHRKWRFTLELCRFHTFFGAMILIASSAHICLIAINRYVLIVHGSLYAQYSSRRAVCAQIMFVWFLSFIAVLPNILGWEAVVSYTDRVGRCNYVRETSKISLSSMLAFGYAIPCAVMAFCYLMIWKTIRASRLKLGGALAVTPVSTATLSPLSPSGRHSKRRLAVDERRRRQQQHLSSGTSKNKIMDFDRELTSAMFVTVQTTGITEEKADDMPPEQDQSSFNLFDDKYLNLLRSEEQTTSLFVRSESSQEKVFVAIDDASIGDTCSMIGYNLRTVSLSRVTEQKVGSITPAIENFNAMPSSANSDELSPLAQGERFETQNCYGNCAEFTNSKLNDNVAQINSVEFLSDANEPVRFSDKVETLQLTKDTGLSRRLPNTHKAGPTPDQLKQRRRRRTVFSAVTEERTAMMATSGLNVREFFVRTVRGRRGSLSSVRMMLAIFLAYFITYLPFVAVNLIDGIASPDRRFSRKWFIISSLSFWSGSCINPIIYGIMNKQFRVAYVDAMSRMTRKYCI